MTSLVSTGDELVQSVTLYKNRHWLLHGHIGPFIPVYVTWIYFWVFKFGVSDHFEPGIFAFVAIGIIQILLCLSCYWSVHVLGLLTCTKVMTCYTYTTLFMI